MGNGIIWTPQSWYIIAAILLFLIAIMCIVYLFCKREKIIASAMIIGVASMAGCCCLLKLFLM